MKISNEAGWACALEQIIGAVEEWRAMLPGPAFFDEECLFAVEDEDRWCFPAMGQNLLDNILAADPFGEVGSDPGDGAWIEISALIHRMQKAADEAEDGLHRIMEDDVLALDAVAKIEPWTLDTPPPEWAKAHALAIAELDRPRHALESQSVWQELGDLAVAVGVECPAWARSAITQAAPEPSRGRIPKKRHRVKDCLLNALREDPTQPLSYRKLAERVGASKSTVENAVKEPGPLRDLYAELKERQAAGKSVRTRPMGDSDAAGLTGREIDPAEAAELRDAHAGNAEALAWIADNAATAARPRGQTSAGAA